MKIPKHRFSVIKSLKTGALTNLFVRVVVFSLAATLSVSCGRRIHIHAQIDNLPDGTVYMVRYDGTVETIDSTLSISGAFALRQPGTLPDIYYIWFPAVPGFFVPMAAEGVELRVSGNLDARDEIVVTGSPGNDAMTELRASLRPYDILSRAIAIDLHELDPQGPDSLAYRALTAKRDSIGQLTATTRRDFVRARPASIVSAMLAASALTDSTTRAQADSLIGELDPLMPDNAFLQRLRTHDGSASH